MGTTGIGSVCGQIDYTTKGICQLATGPIRQVNRCAKPELGWNQGIRFPPILSDNQMSSQDKTRQCQTSNDNTTVAYSSMVWRNTRTINRFSHPTSTITKPTDVPTRDNTPHDPIRTPSVSGLENIQQCLRSEGFSHEASDLVMESRRPGTKLAYRGPWEKWCSWANKKKINPTQATVANIANFLTSQQQRGLEYSTLNTYRSAISAFHKEIDGCSVGQHPRIKQLLKGAFNRNPPKPRYLKTWNVDTVLKTLTKLGDNSELNLKDLSLKLVMLLALASTLRGSELAMLNPENIDDAQDHMIIRFGDLTKTSRPNKPFRKIALYAFSDNVKLDVVTCLCAYLHKTEVLRTDQLKKKRLFIGYTKPHSPVAPCSIARWIKIGLRQAGIDTNVYKAHSTRAASSSKAVAQGLSTEQIMKHANWARASTFQKFYNKPVVINTQLEYQKKVVTLE